MIIPGVFTAAGKQRIDDFFDMFASVMSDTPSYASRKHSFDEWYREAYIDTWKTFAQMYHENLLIPDNYISRQRYASAMTATPNPYIRFFERMAEELESFSKTGDVPSWVLQLQNMNEIMQSETETEQDSSLLTQLAKKADDIVQRTTEQIDETTRRRNEKQAKAAVAWNEYLNALQRLSTIVPSREAGFTLMQTYLGDRSQVAPGDNPLIDAETVQAEWADVLDTSGDTYFLMDILDGPRRYLANYLIEESACVLQQRWEEEVLGPLRGIPSGERHDALFRRDDGLIWKFVNGPGKSFIGLNQSGFYIRRAFPVYLAFTTFLNEGTTQNPDFKSSYLVTMETLPIEVNPEATVQPHASIFELQCVGETASLENYNYTRSRTFTWEPGSCGETSITIMFENMELTRRYPDAMGFAAFLTDFRTGSHRFVPGDFPAYRDALAEKGIEWIRLSYRITGSESIITTYQLAQNPLDVPEQIVSCWSE